MGGLPSFPGCAPYADTVIGLLLKFVVFLASAAIGLLAATWLVDGVSVHPRGFVTAVLIFALAQAILSPFFAKMTSRYASAFLGGVGLVSTLVALALAAWFTGSAGLSIAGAGSWIAATVLVWLVTALATVLLPKLLIGKKVAGR